MNLERHLPTIFDKLLATHWEGSDQQPFDEAYKGPLNVTDSPAATTSPAVDDLVRAVGARWHQGAGGLPGCVIPGVRLQHRITGEIKTHLERDKAFIQMPHRTAFRQLFDYTHIVVHELAHWVRLIKNPDERYPVPDQSMDATYSKEECCAELAAGLALCELDPANADQHAEWAARYLYLYMGMGPFGSAHPSAEMRHQKWAMVKDEAVTRAKLLMDDLHKWYEAKRQAA